MHTVVTTNGASTSRIELRRELLTRRQTQGALRETTRAKNPVIVAIKN